MRDGEILPGSGSGSWAGHGVSAFMIKIQRSNQRAALTVLVCAWSQSFFLCVNTTECYDKFGSTNDRVCSATSSFSPCFSDV